MPKTSKVDICFLCEQAPCECNKKKSKTPAVREKSVSSVQVAEPTGEAHVQPVTRPSMRDKMKAAAAEAPIEQPALSRPTGSHVSVVLPQPPSPPSADDVMMTAIRNLAPLLHPDELDRYKMIVGAEPTLTQRAAFWRASHELA